MNKELSFSELRVVCVFVAGKFGSDSRGQHASADDLCNDEGDQNSQV